jgi:hypothetical protein
MAGEWMKNEAIMSSLRELGEAKARAVDISAALLRRHGVVINPNKIAGALWRLGIKRAKPAYLSTPAGREAFEKAWSDGITIPDLAKMFDCCGATIQRFKNLYSLPHRVGTGRSLPKQPVQSASPPPRVDPPQFAPAPTNPEIIFHTAHVSALLRAAAQIKIQHRPGHCRWPLICDRPTNGDFCHDHAGKIPERRRGAIDKQAAD